MKHYLHFLIITLLGLFSLSIQAQVIFEDDFEDGKGNWKKIGGSKADLSITRADVYSGQKALLLETLTSGADNNAGIKTIELTNGYTSKANYIVSAISKSNNVPNGYKPGIIAYAADGSTSYKTADFYSVSTDYDLHRWVFTSIPKGHDDHYVVRFLAGRYPNQYFFDNVRVEKVEGLINRGFEEGDLMGYLPKVDNTNGAAANFSVVYGSVNSGKAAAKVEVTSGDGTTGSVNLLSDARFYPTVGRTYEFSVYLKGSGNNEEVSVDVNLYDDTNGYLGQESNRVKLTSNYTKYTVTFKAASDVYSIRARIGMGIQASTVYIDDLQITDVTPVNDTPVARDDEFVSNEDEELNESVKTNDYLSKNGGNVFTLATQARNGTVILSKNGMFTYTPNLNYRGADKFVYSLCDIDGDCDTATVNLTINKFIGNRPRPNDDVFEIDQDGVLSADVSVNDTLSEDGGNVFALFTEPSNGVAEIDSIGAMIYTPEPGFFGTDEFKYSVCDIDGNCKLATITVVVNKINYKPVAVCDTFSIDQDSILNENVAVNDSLSKDGGNLIDLLDSVANGTILLENDGSFTYYPTAGFFGEDEFSYTLCDADGDCDTAMVLIIVNEVKPDDMPIAVIDSFDVDKNQILTGSVADNDTLSENGGNAFTVTIEPTNGALILDAAEGNFTYTPNSDFVGMDSFTYTLCDADDDCSTATAYISVNIPLGIGDMTGEVFLCYPNPAKTILNVEGVELGSDIEVFSITGVVVRRIQVVANPTTINLDEMVQGTYILRSGENITKFIKK